ncbi:MAST4 [Cordylochernes scorpioides]|uniref:non-specific serine/threonine protein kinase n=1 Tax=Cordylochernes scorpioides TaxID=51811 RepID=A0ABY6KFP3_9ARAC|nr:MAST4 [Cordylochernes scorpioides]
MSSVSSLFNSPVKKIQENIYPLIKSISLKRKRSDSPCISERLKFSSQSPPASPRTVDRPFQSPKTSKLLSKTLSKLERDLKDLINNTNDAPSDMVAGFAKDKIKGLIECILHKTIQIKLTHRDIVYVEEEFRILISKCKSKSDIALEYVEKTFAHFVNVINPVSRMLSTIDFDLDEFLKQVTSAEQSARQHNVNSELPQYILKKIVLGTMPASNVLSSQVNKSNSKPSPSDFEIIKAISRGAYGRVFLARHRTTNIQLALKYYNKAELSQRNRLEDAIFERNILGFLDHPCIVSIAGSFETLNHLVIAMEFLPGGDCGTMLNMATALDTNSARFYISEAIAGVSYLHAHGIVHRDLKPENLLITRDGHIKVSDFGLSRININNQDEESSEDRLCGTPGYIAPETILYRCYNESVDWWALGIILYQFLIGCTPFIGETPTEVFEETVKGELEWPDPEEWPVDADTKNLINGLLIKNHYLRLTGEQTRSHVFLKGIDWDNVESQVPPYIPQLEDDQDTSNFESREESYRSDSTISESDTEPMAGERSFDCYSPTFKRIVDGKCLNDSSRGGSSPFH